MRGDYKPSYFDGGITAQQVFETLRVRGVPPHQARDQVQFALEAVDVGVVPHLPAPFRVRPLSTGRIVIETADGATHEGSDVRIYRPPPGSHSRATHFIAPVSTLYQRLVLQLRDSKAALACINRLARRDDVEIRPPPASPWRITTAKGEAVVRTARGIKTGNQVGLCMRGAVSPGHMVALAARHAMAKPSKRIRTKHGGGRPQVHDWCAIIAFDLAASKRHLAEKRRPPLKKERINNVITEWKRRLERKEVDAVPSFDEVDKHIPTNDAMRARLGLPPRKRRARR